jgi:hypothetical protein
MPQNFKQAYLNKTRSLDGRSGPNYWQNRADYNIHVDLELGSRIIKGRETIIYHNNSPDILNELLIHLHANIYKKGNAREFDVHFTDETEGVRINTIQINGNEIDRNSIRYIHNDFILNLDNGLQPRSITELYIEWHYRLNRRSHMRTGAVDSSSFFVAYFFPRIAVYDDIDGWNDFKYSGITEFYNDFGNFDVSITVPRHFIVWATGLLQNASAVLKKAYSERYEQAFNTDSIIHIVNAEEAANKHITAKADKNIWKFKADNISDFAFATSDHYLWDATSLVVDQKTARRVLVDVAYNKNSRDFYDVINISRRAIDYMSTKLPGIPFPYPNETVFNGLDEMEYPMMVNDKSFADPSYVIKLTSHEISHSYFPFMMGINESKYAWMDEGWASYFDYQICSELDSPDKASVYYMEKYKRDATSDMNTPMMTNTQYLKRPVYQYNSYAKPAAFLFVLNDYLGDKLFKEALHEYVNRWQGKHPLPYDFFNTYNDVTGQNLNWLFEPWFFKFGYVDLAIDDVSINDSECTVSITSLGNYPAPVRLNIFYADGTIKTLKKNVSVWRNGDTKFVLTFKSLKPIRSLKLDHYLIPDANMDNNEWIINKK